MNTKQSFILLFPNNVSLPGLIEFYPVHAQLSTHPKSQWDFCVDTWSSFCVKSLLSCTLPCKHQQPQSPQALISGFSAEHPRMLLYLLESVSRQKIWSTLRLIFFVYLLQVSQYYTSSKNSWRANPVHVIPSWLKVYII